MNKELIIEKIKKYLANSYNCDIRELDKTGLNIIKDNSDNKLKMLLFYDLILVSTSENLYDLVRERLVNKSVYEIFEFPLVYGQSIYFIPDLKDLKKQEEIQNFEFKLFDGNTNEIELTEGFENAISFDKNGKCNSNIAYCTYHNGQIVGIAGADKINDDIWEVGVEVLPEYRREGLATLLTKNLTIKILEKGIVPIWCASSTNIGSQAVAVRSNYIPLWVESFGNIFDENYVYKDLMRENTIDKGKIIAICGKICSGKSYYANQIKEKENAIVLSTDEVTYDLIDNEQGEFYDRLCPKVNAYLMKKSVELVNIGCNVILDWGFWNKNIRKETTDYYKSKNINIEWHYIDIDDDTWEKNISERNKRVEEGNGGSDFYVTDGLKRKILNKWEKPNESEVDVWYCLNRK